MGNCLFLRARGWGIDRQVRTKLQIPGVFPGGMVTGRIEPCIISSSSVICPREYAREFCSVFAGFDGFPRKNFAFVSE